MKKKVLIIVAYISLFTLVAIISLISIFIGSSVGNFLVDYFSITGWWLLLLLPVVLFVDLAVAFVFLFGLQLIVNQNGGRTFLKIIHNS